MWEENNPTWEIFTLVGSGSEHLPVGSVREHWAADAL